MHCIVTLVFERREDQLHADMIMQGMTNTDEHSTQQRSETMGNEDDHDELRWKLMHYFKGSKSPQSCLPPDPAPQVGVLAFVGCIKPGCQPGGGRTVGAGLIPGVWGCIEGRGAAAGICGARDTL